MSTPNPGQAARALALLDEVLEDIAHVVGGNPGWIDRDMLNDYSERAEAITQYAEEPARLRAQLAAVRAVAEREASPQRQFASGAVVAAAILGAIGDAVPDPAGRVAWRQGRSQPRNIYARTGGDAWMSDELIGHFDTAEYAAAAVQAHNAALEPDGNAPELRITECSAHSDALHVQVNTGHNWLCEFTLKDILAEYEPQPAPGLAAVHTLVGEAIGEASMCWDPRPEGTFESTRAAGIVDRLTEMIDRPSDDVKPAPGVAEAIAEARGYREALERAFDALAKIRQACERPGDIAGKTSGSGIINGRYLAEHLLRILADLG